MCKSCNVFSWNYRLHRQDLEGELFTDGLVMSQLGALATDPKSSDAFLAPDGVGDLKPVNPFASAGIIGVGPDDAPNAIGPNVPTLEVQPVGGNNKTIGTIETNGDQDFRQITLVAGKTYEIGMYSLAGGPNAVALPDAYLELYDSAGRFVTAADGGAKTPANEVNSGFDVLLTFTATSSGTFYINSRAYDNDPTDGTTGEGVGDYEVFAREADPNAPGTYKPYYDLNSPLHAIDWGSRLINKVHETARNPDGDEGTRDTGNAPGDPAPYSGPNQAKTTGNPSGFSNAPAMYDDPLVDSVTDADTNPIGDATPLTFDIPGKNVITVYYARRGEEYKYDDPSTPGLTETLPAAGLDPFEIESMRNALKSYSDVADIVYMEVEQAYVPADPINPQNGLRAYADLTILTYNGTPGTGLLGRHSPPDEGNEGQGEYNRLGPGWNAQGLAPGGFSFVTLIHELGHAHGLAHPHDTGGGSSILRGVEAEGLAFDYTTGDFDLNQAIYTIMSYEDGWPKSPYGNAPTSAGYGYQTGLSAFDIAVIQDKYGVNEEFRTGNDVYRLPDANAVATFNPDGTLATKATGYTSIWDAGGIDEIRYDGARNATIDLRPATLKYEIGGGGWMSYSTNSDPKVDPVYAGFTIANGVTIENATSGSGNDTLVGNAADNVLSSGAGKDLIQADQGGNDTILAGDGNDFIYFGNAMTAEDKVDGGAGVDTVGLIGNYNMTFGAESLVGVERLMMYTNSATVGTASYNLTTVDANVGTAGLFVSAASLKSTETLTFNGSAETDGAFRIQGGAGADMIIGGAKGDYLIGNNGNDQLFGLGGDDTLVGGGGADQLRGGGGADNFRFTSASDSVAGAMDRILDFQKVDKIDLTAIDANTNVEGDQAFTFIGGGAFTGAGQLRATQDATTKVWTVQGDTNGDGIADIQFEVVTVFQDPIVTTDFLL
jgi:Ca2+-binding RTX toxin-like protein